VSLPADFPIVERRAPIGLAVLTVLLVVGAGYAVWNYLPREQPVVAEKVPPVPDRLLASRPAAPSSVEPAGATTTVAPPPPVQETRSTSGGLPAEVWPAPRQDTTVQPAPLAPPVVVAVPAPPPPVVMTIPAIGQAQAAQPPAQVEQQPRGAAQAPVATPPAATEEAVARSPATEATPSMPMKTDTPISVRGDSWVELRAPNGDVLAQTYVRAGETYVVPAGIAYRVIDAR
jgi:cytoskeletal protein RodZ